MKRIDLEFDLDTGAVKAEAEGYDGQACSLDLDPILKATGTVTSRRPKTKPRVVARSAKVKQ